MSRVERFWLVSGEALTRFFGASQSNRRKVDMPLGCCLLQVVR